MEIFEIKTIKGESVITKYYYSYFDEITKKTKNRVCKGCKTKAEAENFVSKLKFISNESYVISKICESLYLPNSEHLRRLTQFGKVYTEKTRRQKRQIIELISKDFGNKYIQQLTIKDVENRLLNDNKHSNSWKNFYLETLKTVYEATTWLCPSTVPCPSFYKFTRNVRKADVFNTAELKHLFNEKNWNCYRDYLMFKLIASCGLRLGEARAIKLNQFRIKDKILIINGFCLQSGERTDWNKSGSKDNNKIRVVLIPDELIIPLVQYIYKNKIENDEYVFNNNKKPITQFYLEKQLKLAIKKAEIRTAGKKFVPHSLRFTYVTRLKRYTENKSVQKLVGHSNEKMTEYYTRFGINELVINAKKESEAINKLFE